MTFASLKTSTTSFAVMYGRPDQDDSPNYELSDMLPTQLQHLTLTDDL